MKLFQERVMRTKLDISVYGIVCNLVLVMNNAGYLTFITNQSIKMLARRLKYVISIHFKIYW